MCYHYFFFFLVFIAKIQLQIMPTMNASATFYKTHVKYSAGTYCFYLFQLYKCAQHTLKRATLKCIH